MAGTSAIPTMSGASAMPTAEASPQNVANDPPRATSATAGARTARASAATTRSNRSDTESFHVIDLFENTWTQAHGWRMMNREELDMPGSDWAYTRTRSWFQFRDPEVVLPNTLPRTPGGMQFATTGQPDPWSSWNSWGFGNSGDRKDLSLIHI